MFLLKWKCCVNSNLPKLISKSNVYGNTRQDTRGRCVYCCNPLYICTALLDSFSWCYVVREVMRTETRVTFRSGTVTRHGTSTCVVRRVMKMVSRPFALPSLELPLIRNGCVGSRCRKKGKPLKGNLNTSCGNSSYYPANFVNEHMDLQQPDNVPLG